MRIDAHQHFWQYDANRLNWITDDMTILQRDWLPDDLQPQLQEAQIDATVAVQATAHEAETDFLLGQASHHPWIGGVIGWTDLRRADAATRIARYHENPALVGFRHQLQDTPQYMADAAFNHGINEVQRQSLVYEVLLFHQQLRDGVRFCRQHDKHWLVIDHLAKPAMGRAPELFAAWRSAMAELATMPHTAVKVSGLMTEAAADLQPAVLSASIVKHLDTALELFGEDRLLFGSDWPVCLLAVSYRGWYERVMQWLQDKGAGMREKFFGGNAARIYSLNEVPRGDRHGS